MAETAGRPREARIDDSVRAAVHSLLATDGYAGTTIDAVAKRANVGRGAIYRRWGSKAELVFANVVHATDLEEPEDTGTLAGDLETLALRIHKLTGTPAGRAALIGLIGDPEVGQTLDRRAFSAERSYLEAILARAVRRGELGAAPDPELVRRMLVSPIAFAPLLSPGREETDPRAVARIVTAGLLESQLMEGAP